MIQNIYPQDNGMPIYSPSGKYWVKLYHMGKQRRIEIDDRMPCTANEEFLLPKCEKIDIIWPHVLTKALLKLYSYQYQSYDYVNEEVGDLSVVYALTGYIGEYYLPEKGESKSESKIF